MSKKTDLGPNHTEYMQLDKLLGAQEPLSFNTTAPVHDEMLFIISQQVFELWFKQILHDLDSVLTIFKSDWVNEKDLGIVVPRLERIAQIQQGMLQIFPILETMTPLDFLEFRGLFKNASGFQSVQFRKLESLLGVNFPISFNLEGIDRNAPNLLHSVERWLERTPFLHFKGFDFWTTYRKAVEKKLEADDENIQMGKDLTPDQKKGAHQSLKVARESFEALLNEETHNRLREKGERRLSHKATQAALLIFLYRDQPILQLPFKLLTLLIDIDDRMTAWRHRHAQTVFRMIGKNPGSAYTAGYAYLVDTIESRRVFSDLANLSTYLIPRSQLPKLPKDVERNLGFRFDNGREK